MVFKIQTRIICKNNILQRNCPFLPDLSVLCEGGHSRALLRVVLRQAGADLQHIWLARLGDHHGVVERCRHRPWGLRLSWLLTLRLKKQRKAKRA